MSSARRLVEASVPHQNQDDMGVPYTPDVDELRVCPTGGDSNLIFCRRGFDKFKAAERQRGPHYEKTRWEDLKPYDPGTTYPGS